MSNRDFSAVLLAGGKSLRMGQDKAGVIVDGWPMWKRQMATLNAVAPLEAFISGKPDGPYAGAGFEIVLDAEPGCGPIGGLAAACHHARSPFLCVLAIDLPWMTSSFLMRLMDKARIEGRGIVPHNGERFEPLAAVYSRAMLPLISQHLSQRDYSMQHLIRRAREMDLVVALPIAEEEAPLFRNINSPTDLADL